MKKINFKIIFFVFILHSAKFTLSMITEKGEGAFGLAQAYLANPNNYKVVSKILADKDEKAIEIYKKLIGSDYKTRLGTLITPTTGEFPKSQKGKISPRVIPAPEIEQSIDPNSKNPFNKNELNALYVKMPAALFELGLPIKGIVDMAGLFYQGKISNDKKNKFEKGEIVISRVQPTSFAMVDEDLGNNVAISFSHSGKSKERPKDHVFKFIKNEEHKNPIDLIYKNINQYFTLPASFALMSVANPPSMVFDKDGKPVSNLLDIPEALYYSNVRLIRDDDWKNYGYLGTFWTFGPTINSLNSYFDFDENNKFSRGEIVLDRQLKNIGIIYATNIDPNNPNIYGVQFNNPNKFVDPNNPNIPNFEFRKMKSNDIGKLLPESAIKETAKHLQEQNIIPKDVAIVLAKGSNFFVWRFKDIIQHYTEDEAIKKLSYLKEGFDKLKDELLKQKDKDISKLKDSYSIEKLLGTEEQIKLEGAGLTQKDIDDLIKDKNNQKEKEMENLKNLNIFNIADQGGYTPIKFAQFLDKQKVVGYLLSEAKNK